MRLLPVGEQALLVELDEPGHRRALTAALHAEPPPGVREIVPASRTVLLVLDPGVDPSALADDLRSRPLETPTAPAADAPTVTVPVTYDGPDLAEVATLLDVSPEEVVRRHTAQTWTCEFLGFTPGFGYLSGERDDLAVPRRDTPRTRIPAGSVALAAGLSAVYPSDSPGGWQIVGRTDVTLFDPDRDPPSLLQPGTLVRFTDGEAP